MKQGNINISLLCLFAFLATNCAGGKKLVQNPEPSDSLQVTFVRKIDLKEVDKPGETIDVKFARKIFFGPVAGTEKEDNSYVIFTPPPRKITSTNPQPDTTDQSPRSMKLKSFWLTEGIHIGTLIEGVQVDSMVYYRPPETLSPVPEPNKEVAPPEPVHLDFENSISVERTTTDPRKTSNKTILCEILAQDYHLRENKITSIWQGMTLLAGEDISGKRNSVAIARLYGNFNREMAKKGYDSNQSHYLSQNQIENLLKDYCRCGQ